MNSRLRVFVLLAAVLCIVVVGGLAQDTSQTTVTKGTATHEVQVAKGEVVYVSGDDLVVKAEDGQVHHFRVPANATATVDGKEIAMKDLKPGMILQRTITTTSTPEVVTTVRTIQGKVWHVSAPSTVVLTLPDGENKQYRVPRGQKFSINGKDKTVWDLKKGMNVTATVVTETPEVMMSQTREVTGTTPPPPTPPPTPPVVGVLLIEEAPAPAVAAAVHKPELPQTGSFIPLVGLCGFLSLAGAFGLRWFRKFGS